MDRRPIGVFDSGLGGLTTVKHLMTLAPHEDIVFLGDTARVPYGNRTSETITAYAIQDISYLLRHDVKMVVAACGTVSATFPGKVSSLIPVPFVTVITPTALAAAAATRNKKVGILGTAATIRSNAFVRALAAKDPGIKAIQQAAPLLVPLVEAGYTSKDCGITQIAVREYTAPLKAAGADTVILGCTHYPILANLIAKEFERDTILIDSGYETARQVFLTLKASDSLNTSGGTCQFYTTDDPTTFIPLAELFLGESLNTDVIRTTLDNILPDPCFEGV